MPDDLDEASDRVPPTSQGRKDAIIPSSSSSSSRGGIIIISSSSTTTTTTTTTFVFSFLFVFSREGLGLGVVPGRRHQSRHEVGRTLPHVVPAE